jgi:hypothetical protein
MRRPVVGPQKGLSDYLPASQPFFKFYIGQNPVGLNVDG